MPTRRSDCRCAAWIVVGVVIGFGQAEGLSAAEKTPKGTAVKFKTYGAPYFVKNNFEPKADQSFVVIKNLEHFEKVFGVGMVMGGPTPGVNPDTFKSQMIVAVIKRGPMCKFEVEGVATAGKGLQVRYKVMTDPPDTATFAVPLIISVPKGDYLAVVFMENGKETKVVK